MVAGCRAELTPCFSRYRVGALCGTANGTSSLQRTGAHILCDRGLRMAPPGRWNGSTAAYRALNPVIKRKGTCWARRDRLGEATGPVYIVTTTEAVRTYYGHGHAIAGKYEHSCT